jgi:hypothetical protein
VRDHVEPGSVAAKCPKSFLGNIADVGQAVLEVKLLAARSNDIELAAVERNLAGQLESPDARCRDCRHQVDDGRCRRCATLIVIEVCTPGVVGVVGVWAESEGNTIAATASSVRKRSDDS